MQRLKNQKENSLQKHVSRKTSAMKHEFKQKADARSYVFFNEFVKPKLSQKVKFNLKRIECI